MDIDDSNLWYMHSEGMLDGSSESRSSGSGSHYDRSDKPSSSGRSGGHSSGHDGQRRRYRSSGDEDNAPKSPNMDAKEQKAGQRLGCLGVLLIFAMLSFFAYRTYWRGDDDRNSAVADSTLVDSIQDSVFCTTDNITTDSTAETSPEPSKASSTNKQINASSSSTPSYYYDDDDDDDESEEDAYNRGYDDGSGDDYSPPSRHQDSYDSGYEDAMEDWDVPEDEWED